MFRLYIAIIATRFFFVFPILKHDNMFLFLVNLNTKQRKVRVIYKVFGERE